MFSGDDDAAIGETNAPPAVALAGFDDQRGVAAQQLLRCMAGEKVERVTRLATTVVIRQSCGCM